MRAVTWQGKEKMEVRNVSDPTIIEPTDAIIRITATAICGSDLHLYHHGGAVLEEGYVVGHEPMGIVEEVGSQVQKLKKGDRVVIPLILAVDIVIFVKMRWRANVITLLINFMVASLALVS
mgnify:CR=1 FL=1